MGLVYKMDEEGRILTNDSGLPLVVDEEKKEEYGIDAINNYAQIPKLRNEAKNHRLKSEELTGRLNILASKGVDVNEPEKLNEWLEKATESIDTVSNLSDGKLIQAGEVEIIKKQASENMQSKLEEQKKLYQDKLGEYEKSVKQKEDTIYKLMVDDKFNTSKFVNDKLAMTPKMARSYFGPNFRIEPDDNGQNKVIGYLNSGEKIYSKERAGEIADFNEALQIMVERDPDRNSLFKTKPGGSGSIGSTGNAQDMQGKSSKDKIKAGIMKLKGL